MPSSASLDGTVTDDGLPNPPGAVTTTWSRVSGPGTVTFANANAVDTTASFSVVGTYVLRLTASDGALSASDDVTTTVNQANQLPSVNAGPDQTITLPSSATLDGTVTDDGLPNPPATVTTTWSRVSGPGTVTFANANAVDTTASFSDAGTYVLRLTANDGALSASDDVSIVVFGAGGEIVKDVRVAASSDDAEESATGTMSLTSTDLELVHDGSDQRVGMRFNGVDIPKNATIVNAYIQFKVDEATSTATSLTIQGQNVDNATTFTTATSNISSRPRTTAAVSWSPVSWPIVGEAGTNQRTPNIASIIQEIINRSGWSSGNSMVIIVTGTGHRVAESFNGDQAGAPLLHVVYSLGTDQPPAVNAGPDQTVTLPNSATLDGTVTDDGLPNPPGAFTTTWSMVSGPGMVTFANANAVDTTASFSVSGTYVLRLTANDGGLTASDDVTIVVNGDTIVKDIRVAAGTDDAEETATGSMRLTNNDLELVFDGSNQTVGMRFNRVDVPKNVTIVNAYIQFKVDEVSSEATSLTIQGQNVDNVTTFTSIKKNISSRQRTVAAVSWSPVPWTTVGESGPNQQTPNIASVIQEVVNRSGWSSGNSLVLIITGTGRRVAESFEGDQAGAPLLHVEYK